MHSEWQASEDSFLKLCCQINEFEWGRVYYWNANVNWPKLNFIRITNSNLSKMEFMDIERNFRPFFENNDIDFNIKIPRSVSVNDEIKSKLRNAGTPICFLKTTFREKRNVNKKLRLKKVESIEEFNEWWCIFSTFPTREEKLNSPFYPVAKSGFENNTIYYLGYFDNQPVSCFAIDLFDERKINLWGVATKEEFKRKGIFKDLQYLMFKDSNQEIYLQVNLDSPLYKYYLGKPETTLLEQEVRYEII